MIITLLGFMGSGKSTFGKKLAKKLNYRFIDLDDFIEKKERKTIAEIFELSGEELFRKLETNALKDCLKIDNSIVALGGGTPCFFNNMELINKSSKSVYLKMNTKALANRLQKEQAKRPLLKNLNSEELLSFISLKLKEREPYYSKAKILVNGENLKVEEVLKIIE